VIKITLQHYIFDFALSHIFNKYVDEFAISKYITFHDLNKSHLSQYLNVFDDGSKTYKEGVCYGRTIVNIQIVSANHVGRRAYNQYSYYVMIRIKTESNYYPVIVLPFTEDCTAMLK
jgi:hypothetical protein